MRVGIDARKISDFGIGTYIRGLLQGLVELGAGDEYVVFAPAGASLPSGIEHIIVDAPHYSVRELVVVGRAADRASLDVFHAPHYVVPFTSAPLVVTIHDLIHLHQPMRNPLAPVYARTMIGRAVRKARRVLTVSEAVKRDLEREFDAKNVIVTPNGVVERPTTSYDVLRSSTSATTSPTRTSTPSSTPSRTFAASFPTFRSRWWAARSSASARATASTRAASSPTRSCNRCIATPSRS